MTKEGVGNNQKDMQTLVHEKENQESDGIDDQDENTDDLCGESDCRKCRDSTLILEAQSKIQL